MQWWWNPWCFTKSLWEQFLQVYKWITHFREIERKVENHINLWAKNNQRYPALTEDDGYFRAETVANTVNLSGFPLPSSDCEIEVSRVSCSVPWTPKLLRSDQVQTRPRLPKDVFNKCGQDQKHFWGELSQEAKGGCISNILKTKHNQNSGYQEVQVV